MRNSRLFPLLVMHCFLCCHLVANCGKFHICNGNIYRQIFGWPIFATFEPFALILPRTQYARTELVTDIQSKCIYWKYIVEADLSKLTYNED